MIQSRPFRRVILSFIVLWCVSIISLLAFGQQKAFAFLSCDPPDQHYKFGLIRCPDGSTGFRCISDTACECSNWPDTCF